MADLEFNPLLDQDGLPKFPFIKPSNLSPAVKHLLEKLLKDFTNLESKLSSDTSDFDDVLPVVEKLQFSLGYVWGVAGHLNGVKNGDELRAAYEENQPDAVKAMTQFSQSRALYDALTAVETSLKSADENDFKIQQQKRAVEGSLRGMKL